MKEKHTTSKKVRLDAGSAEHLQDRLESQNETQRKENHNDEDDGGRGRRCRVDVEARDLAAYGGGGYGGVMAASAMPAFAAPPRDGGGDNAGGNFKGSAAGDGGTSFSNGSLQGQSKKEECGVHRNPHVETGGFVC
jgi:hypothetical protein